MKILVTGGSGTVGKYIVDELALHHHSVGILDIIKPQRADIRFHCASVLSLDDVCDALNGYDAVVHCAGIPHPLNDPAEKVFTVNVNGTFNVLEASARNNIRKVVFTSSESTLGFAFMANRMAPDYIPIDEHHSLRPQDVYGLSKVIGEQICRSYSARYGIRTICLREPWIWVPEKSMISLYKKLISGYGDWHKNLWAYVHVYDAARAHRLALEKDLENFHETFFITAKENWTGKNSKELLSRYYPEAMTVNGDYSGAFSLISYGKAKALLGYEPGFSAEDIFAA